MNAPSQLSNFPVIARSGSPSVVRALGRLYHGSGIWCHVVLIAVLSVFALAGCGGGSAQQPTVNQRSVSEASKPDATIEEVAHALKSEAVPDNGSFDYRADNGDLCSVPIVLFGESSIRLYSEAGDLVATNPSETVGVKIVPYQGSSDMACLNTALARIQDL